MRISDVVDSLHEYAPHADPDLIYKAYVYSARVHQGQKRFSGEPYLNHPLWVAYILTLLNADVPTIAAGLLHDTIEDTWATHEDIEDTFGTDIASLVDGVTKLSKLRYTNKEAHKADNFRKMFVAMAQDLRVILIKLADRLHNMRTLEFMPDSKRIPIAEETLDLYAPIAGRLGIQWLKSELEDLSFRYLYPAAYFELAEAVATQQAQSESYIASIVARLRTLLSDAGIQGEVSGRPKHLYSIWRKMQKQGIGIEQVFDLIAFRVVVPELRHCYEVLGLVHTTWTPVPGRFKDYIAMPKANRYQSLHTTVIGPEGRPIEVQIRTHEMHAVAEMGIAAHWAYKEDKSSDDEQKAFTWLRQLYEWHRELADSKQFVETVRVDLFQDESYVFTPTGDVIELPAGSTPLDFAYKIHTEVGHHAHGAKVDGRLVPLNTRLESGNIVEILTHPAQRPRHHWLKWVRTSNARQKIRAYLNRSERNQALELGRTLLERALKEAGVTVSVDTWLGSEDAKRILAELKLEDRDDLVRAFGYGKLGAQRLKQLLGAGPQQAKPERRLLGPFDRLLKRGERKSGGALIVAGLKDVETQIARCCNPLPGDDVQGYIRVGQGIRVHKSDCPNLLGANPERIVPVDWSGVGGTRRTVQLNIEVADTPGILAKMGKAVGDLGINIVEATIRSSSGGRADGMLAVDVDSRAELDRVVNELRKLRGVMRIERRN